MRSELLTKLTVLRDVISCSHINIVTYLLKARIAGPEKLSLLGNGSVNTFPRQRIHIQQKRYCWKRCFQLGPYKGVIRKTIEATESVLYEILSRTVQLEGSRRSHRTEHVSREIVNVRSRYQKTSSEDKASCEKFRVCCSDL
jgi:hypothetical protein